MSVAPTMNFGLEGGASGELRLTWRDKATQQPYDLTGWSGIMRISTRPATDLPVVLGASEYNVQVDFSPAITAALADSTKISYQIDLTDPAGRIKRLVKGRINVGRSL